MTHEKENIQTFPNPSEVYQEESNDFSGLNLRLTDELDEAERELYYNDEVAQAELSHIKAIELELGMIL